MDRSGARRRSGVALGFGDRLRGFGPPAPSNGR